VAPPDLASDAADGGLPAGAHEQVPRLAHLGRRLRSSRGAIEQEGVEQPAALDPGPGGQDLLAEPAGAGADDVLDSDEKRSAELRQGGTEQPVGAERGQVHRDGGCPRPLDAGVGGARAVDDRRVAALGSDGNNDTAPSTTEGVAFPIHVLAINAMGIHLLDFLQFEDLVRRCEEAERWDFLFVAAPLRIDGGTGSPVNPIAIL
jgi:hypothetical protein